MKDVDDIAKDIAASLRGDGCVAAPADETAPVVQRVRAGDKGSDNYHNSKGIEVWDTLDAYFGDSVKYFYAGNIVKYALRFVHKGQEAKDVAKLLHYAEKLKELYNEDKD